MSDTRNSPSGHKKQPNPDHNLAHQLEAKILNHLRMAIRYADLAEQHYEIFDNFGFDRSVKEFVDHARDAANTLKKLRQTRGVTE
jgi:hypothetical protein